MSNNSFLKSGFKIRGGFKGDSRSFMNEFKTVCIKHINGKITERHHISDPWRYIAKVKKNLDVEDAWIKAE